MHYVEVLADHGLDYADVRVYCSDACARTDPDYAGWNGGHENPDAAEYCVACGVLANVHPDCGCSTVLVNRFPTDRTEYCEHGNALQVPIVESDPFGGIAANDRDMWEQTLKGE